ncbi:MAG: efflux transporter permease subunit [Proteobacteria bacterium]|nr:efflux transporter permease subunit [Pseudomonadota bacterium]
MSAESGLGIAGRITRLFQDNAITPLLALLLFLLGIFAVGVTPREEEPQIDVTMANVFVAFPGASVGDVESMIATPAEQVLSRMPGVEHVTSVSQPGQAIVTVQFKVGVPRSEALVRLHDTLQSHRDWLPSHLGAQEPVVKPSGIDDVPVLALTLFSRDEKVSAFDLERVAHALEVELKRVPGSRDIRTIGGPGQAVNVYLDADRMRRVGVSVSEIEGALNLRNAGGPAGALVEANRRLMVETSSFLQSAQDVAEVVVTVRAGKPVQLGDVARIEAGPPLPERYVWHGVVAQGQLQGEFPAVTVQITKKPGENAVVVAERLMERVAALRNTVLPASVELAVTRNYGETANDKSQKLIQKLLFATASVVALVWLALGRREAVIVGTAVILTLAATLFASWAWGFTLNRVSLFALIFSIGILVDDAIVVVENIHRHRELEPQASFFELMPRAVDEVGGPTILATLTVIAALLPMAFVSGLMGPYMAPIPINASLGMLISLAVAFVVTPWLAGKLMRKLPHAETGEGARPASGLHHFTERLFTPFFDPLRGARHRLLLWLAVLGLILISLALPIGKLVILKMLPFDNKSEFQVMVDMPAGTPLERTAAVVRELAAQIATLPEVTDYQAYVGTASPITFNGLVRQYALRMQPEQADIQVELVDKHHRSRQSHVIARAILPSLQVIAQRAGAKIKLVEVPPGPPVMAPIVAEVYGPDALGRRDVARRIEASFSHTDGITAVDGSVIADTPKLRLHVDARRAASLGVSQAQIAEALGTALGGTDVTYLRDGQAKYPVPVRLRLAPEQQARIEDALKLSVSSASGVQVPLSEVLRVEQGLLDQPVYHKDLLPVSYVMGDAGGAIDSPLYGMFALREKLFGKALPEGGELGEYWIHQPEDPYRGYAIKWDGEWQITYETFRDMGSAYAVGLVLIYLLVVAQFRSYLVPLIIMAPIPLTIIGVMPGHALLGAQYTATSMIGMIALAGIIVRNSILLVDFIQLQVGEGVSFDAAVINAVAARAKPIVLTALAAMLGALFILDDPIFNGLAVSLLFGIAVSTLLTLVVIPLLYYVAYHPKTQAEPL